MNRIIRIDAWTRLKLLLEEFIDGRVTLHYSIDDDIVFSGDYEGSKVRIEGKLTVTHFPGIEISERR